MIITTFNQTVIPNTEEGQAFADSWEEEFKGMGASEVTREVGTEYITIKGFYMMDVKYD